MRHVILMCRNHTNLRWSTKEIAVSNGKYNGTRNIFFLGEPSGFGMYCDGSGLDCVKMVREESGDYRVISECSCPASDLVIAPEDRLVKR